MSEEKNGSKYGHLFSFAGSNKAGMENMDKEKQAQIIYEMSKDSAFFKRAVAQDKKIAERVEAMKKKRSALTKDDVMRLEKEVNVEIAKIEASRNLNRICAVLDMDMFFAAVEIRDRPELKNVPVAVGGSYMISTSNYVARKFGVRAAMPGFIAKKLCPQLVFVSTNFNKYKVVSDQVKEIVKEYDPDFSSMSLDEVYMDLTDYVDNCLATEMSNSLSNTDGGVCSGASDDTIKLEQRRRHADAVVHTIRQRICHVTNGLTASAGIANNFRLAKIGADINKPNGQFSLRADKNVILQMVAQLPTRKVCGIGKATENTLTGLGINSMGDVRASIATLYHIFTPSTAKFLLHACMGVDSDEMKSSSSGSGSGTEVQSLTSYFTPRADATNAAVKHGHKRASPSSGYVPVGSFAPAVESSRKSLGQERTFAAISEFAAAQQKLEGICRNVSEDLIKKKLIGQTLTVKLKNTDFEVLSRRETVGSYCLQSYDSLYALGVKLLLEMFPITIRLLGITVSKFDATGSGGKLNQLPLNRFLADKTVASKAPTVVDRQRDLESLPDEYNEDSFVSSVDGGERDVVVGNVLHYSVTDEYEEEENIEDDVVWVDSQDCDEDELPIISTSSAEVVSSSVTNTLLRDKGAEDTALPIRSPCFCCPVCFNDISRSIERDDDMWMSIHINNCLDRKVTLRRDNDVRSDVAVASSSNTGVGPMQRYLQPLNDNGHRMDPVASAVKVVAKRHHSGGTRVTPWSQARRKLSL